MSAAVTGEIVATPTAGTSMQTGMGRGVSASGDTATAAVSAQQVALVQAAYIMAERRPRDMDKVRVNLLAACRRPLFAKAGKFKKPVGKEFDEDLGKWVEKFAEGFSIRFAEEAMRNMGNMKTDSYTVYDDPKKKIVKFPVLELEGNTEWSKTITVEKTTERKKLKKGQTALYQRLNSYGDTVYVVEATAAEVEKMEAGLASKAWRDGILKNLPADIKEECWAQILATVANEDAKDPSAAKKAVIDSFASIGVGPDYLKEYLEHGLETLSPAELEELRGIYMAISDGEITWAAVAEEREETRTAQAAEDTKRGKGGAPATSGSAVDDAVAAARKKREDAAKEKKAAAEKAAAEAAAKVTSGKSDEKTATGTTAATTAKPTAPDVSTQKQRTEVAQLATEAGFKIGEVCSWVGKATTPDLTQDEADRVISMIKAKTGEVANPPVPSDADINAALSSANLPPEVINDWFQKPIGDLDDDERREAVKLAGEA